MELTEKQQIERIAKAVSHLAGCSIPLHKCDVCEQIKSSVLSPAPEQTPFQKHMAKTWPDIRPGSTEWIDMRRGWNAAVDAGIAKQTPGDKSLPWVAVSALERLKEPVV